MTPFFKLISIVFHPILFPTLGSVIYFILSPHHFPYKQKNIILIIIFISTYIIPILLLVILKKLKMINSLELSSIEERKFPILFSMVLTFMLGKMLLRTGMVDLLAFSFYGASLSLAIVFLLFQRRIKTSLHTLTIGSLIGFVMVMSKIYQTNLIILISILFLLSGVIATSRLFLKAHYPKEVYLGLFIGISTQFITFLLLK